MVDCKLLFGNAFFMRIDDRENFNDCLVFISRKLFCGYIKGKFYRYQSSFNNYNEVKSVSAFLKDYRQRGIPLDDSRYAGKKTPQMTLIDWWETLPLSENPSLSVKEDTLEFLA